MEQSKAWQCKSTHNNPLDALAHVYGYPTMQSIPLADAYERLREAIVGRLTQSIDGITILRAGNRVAEVGHCTPVADVIERIGSDYVFELMRQEDI